MADQNQSSHPLSDQLADQLQHLLRILRIQRTSRLIGQHQPRPIGQRSRHRDALLLSDGELSRLVVQPLGQTPLLPEMPGPLGVVGRPVKLMPSSTFSSAVKPGNR